jgi:hypothetical protein
MRSSCHSLDRVEVIFDDERAVADPGMILVGMAAQHLGLRELVDRHVDLGDAPGRANAGLKAVALVASLVAGGDSIDDIDALRAGSAGEVLGQWVPAPSTIGTFLRSFSFGHARQLDVVAGELLGRAWSAGAGPGEGPVTIDVDSTICETYGLAKQGARFGHTHVRGYHPLVAATSDSDVIGVRLRGGNAHSGRGAAGFVTESINRVRAAGATGPMIMRADSGFYNHKVVDACVKAGAAYSITVKLYKGLHRLIAAIAETDWTPIPYWISGGADVAEMAYRPFGKKGRTCRLIVRRTRPTPGSQLALFATWSYHAFITDRPDDTLVLEADHRRHAEIENVIRDLKYGVGLNHLPSGRFGANAAWLAFCAIAHNLARWTALLGLGDNAITTETLRRRYLRVPGHLTHRSRRTQLHLAARWPWKNEFLRAVARLRGLEVLTT